MLSNRQTSYYAKSTVNSIYIILINIERVSKHSVTLRGLRVVTTCWSWAWSKCTPPLQVSRLGSPLAACSVYGDLTCSAHTVNNLCMFICHCYLCNRGPYVRLEFVPNMLSSWNKDAIIIIISFMTLRKFGSLHYSNHWNRMWQKQKKNPQNPILLVSETLAWDSGVTEETYGKSGSHPKVDIFHLWNITFDIFH